MGYYDAPGSRIQVSTEGAEACQVVALDLPVPRWVQICRHASWLIDQETFQDDPLRTWKGVFVLSMLVGTPLWILDLTLMIVELMLRNAGI